MKGVKTQLVTLYLSTCANLTEMDDDASINEPRKIIIIIIIEKKKKEISIHFPIAQKNAFLDSQLSFCPI